LLNSQYVIAMNPYAHLVAEYARFFRSGKNYQLGGFPPLARPTPAQDAPVGLIFSPHPDDECIIGALAIRLMRESGWNIRNVAVTQGSNRERQAERLLELRNACDYLGFGLIQTAPNGLEAITPKARSQDPAGWAAKVKLVADLLLREKPRAIFVPHEHDWNGTHIGVHFLVQDALATLPREFSTFLVDTEYWGQMTRPNLMVDTSEQQVTDQVSALSFHVGEVQRNPFHLLLPAWMQDNVRRGSELVGGQGGAAPDFGFATLYRLRAWREGALQEVQTGGRNLSVKEPAGVLFA
jgi:LmbE family N-acetylglucosaminyl deacetylase